MATGDGDPSMSIDSEEVLVSECYKCSKEGKHVEAEAFCVECGCNFCRRCLNDHNEFAILKAHEIQYKSAVKPGTTQGALHPPTEKCVQHHGRLIDTYCASHDVVCCSVCVSVDHTTCPDVKYIPTVASGISTNKELQDAQTATDGTKTQLEGLKKTRLENLMTVRKERTEALESVTESARQLIKHIEDLNQKTAVEINDKYQKFETAINDDLSNLDKMITTLSDAQNQLQTSQNNETKLFVHLKQNQGAISAGRKLATSCIRNTGSGCCIFVADDSIEKHLKGIKSLGIFEEELEYSAVHVSYENITHSKDTARSVTTGICSLDDGSLMIADWENARIKKLDTSYQVVSQLDIPEKPVDICQISSSEVALTMSSDKKIQFVSVGQSMSLTGSFNTIGEGQCQSIACKDGKLYVCRHLQENFSCVQIYNMSGSLLQTIQTDQSGSSIFNRPYAITINPWSSNIYVADFDTDLIILDKSGQLLTKVTDPDLRRALAVCVLPGDQLLVCGWGTNNVIQFDGHGKKVKTLLTESDGICLRKPRSMYFDPSTFRLLIGMTDCDYIEVFSLVRT